MIEVFNHHLLNPIGFNLKNLPNTSYIFYNGSSLLKAYVFISENEYGYTKFKDNTFLQCCTKEHL